MMNGTIIFSIPIYALNPDKLKQKYNDKIVSLNKEFPNMVDEGLIEYVTFPQRIWEHNHIVGYIDISAKLRDIYFNVYLPYKGKPKKYHWLSSKKILISLEMHDYPHFTVFDEDSNEIIIEKIEKHIDEVQKLIPKTYYIDKKAFL